MTQLQTQLDALNQEFQQIVHKNRLKYITSIPTEELTFLETLRLTDIVEGEEYLSIYFTVDDREFNAVYSHGTMDDLEVFEEEYGEEYLDKVEELLSLLASADFNIYQWIRILGDARAADKASRLKEKCLGGTVIDVTEKHRIITIHLDNGEEIKMDI